MVRELAYDGSIKIDTKVDTDGFYSGIEQMKSIASKGVSVLTTTFAAVNAGIVAGGTAAVSVGSDFEAQISRVSAISGATEKELKKLKDQAVELGAKTAFSAKEAVEGMENLASAGFSVTEITKAMPGMLDLAASSGENLATASDIAASTLRGFGLEASQASHVADVLAKNAADTNAAVADTGEAMKYIAPLAKSAGISLEETAAAIGIMADNGIKGGQAGTTLRAALSRLSKPTDVMTATMDKLNIKFYDSHGKMKSLSEQCSMLKTATKDLTDEERNNAIVTLYGQEALSGMLALMNSKEGRLESLTKSYEACDGAAAEMATTMQDNLKSKVEELSGSIETLGISIYEDLKEPLKDATVEGIEYVNQLTKAFDNGGLKGLVEEAGDIFGELAVKATEAAPQMVEASIDFIESFCNGIAKNSGKLIKAVKTIVNTIVDNLVKLLPSGLQKPVKEAVDIIRKSFENGGLKKAIETVKNILSNLGKVATSLAKTTLPQLAKIIDTVAGNLDNLLPIAVSVYTAYKSWTIISTITALFKAHTAAVTAESLAEAASLGTITLKQIAVGALTGQISLATAAQYAWNMAISVSPLGLALTAVTALIAGVVALTLTYDENRGANADLIVAQENLQRTNENLGNSYEEVADKFSGFLDDVKNSGSIFDDFNEEILISDEEKQRLSDNMDNVQSEITEVARLASEERRKLTGEEIKRLEELFEEMHKLSEQELALEKAKQGVVTTQAKALNETVGISLDEYTQRAKKLENTAEETRTAVVDKAYEQYTEEVALLDLRLQTDAEYSEKEHQADVKAAEKRYQDAVDAANKEAGDTLAIIQQGYYDRADVLKEYTDKLTKLQDDEEKENQTHKDNLQKIDDEYNKAMEELMSKKMNSQLRNNEADRLLHEKKEAEEEENTRNLKKIEELRNEQHKLLDDENYQNQLVGFLHLESLYETYTGKTGEHSEEIVNSFFKPMESMPEDAKEKFKLTLSGALDGISEMGSTLYHKAEELASGFIGRFKKMFDIHSPSRVFKKIFKQTIEGAEIGADDESKNLYKIADDISSDFTKRMQVGVSADGLISKMKSAVSAGRSFVANKLTATVFHDVNINNNDNNKKFTLKGDVVSHISIDGREFAVVTAPYVSEELAWEDR